MNRHMAKVYKSHGVLQRDAAHSSELRTLAELLDHGVSVFGNTTQAGRRKQGHTSDISSPTWRLSSLENPTSPLDTESPLH